MVSRKMLGGLPAPAFPRALFSNPDPKPLSNTAWIDGVRGLAALIVAVDHLFWSEIGPLFRGYGASPDSASAAQNRSLLQLPLVRILWAGSAMVPLFFVVSGYCVSLSSIRARRRSAAAAKSPNHHHHLLLPTLSSALFRRALRLFLPVAFISAASQALYFLGAYTWPWLEEAASLPPPLAQPAAHLSYLLSYLFGLLDSAVSGFNCPFGGPCVRGLNTQLWTLPLELRGSVLVYAALIALAGVRSRPRLCALGGLAGVLWARGWWDLATFTAGLLVAEVELQRRRNESAALPTASAPARAARPGWRGSGSGGGSKWKAVGTTALFLAGWYLLCVPQDGEEVRFSPCFAFLEPFTPRRWLDAGGNDRARDCWRSLGGAMLVAALSASSEEGAGGGALRKPFESPAAQYFGRISFMLYLVHQVVIRVLLMPVRGAIVVVLGEERMMTAVYLAGGVMLVVAFWAAEVLVEVVDRRSVLWAKKLLEMWSDELRPRGEQGEGRAV